MTQRVSVSIVVYKTDTDDVRKALSSVKRAAEYARLHGRTISCSIDVVNNCSDASAIEALDFLRTEFAEVTLINSERNGGYGYGNNVSIRRNSESNFHLVMNPDVVLGRDFFAVALEYMEGNSHVGLVVPKIFGTDGAVQQLCKRNPTLAIMLLRAFNLRFFEGLQKKLNWRYLMKDCDYDKVILGVDYPSGCCLFFRMEVLRLIDCFDERYFLHYEDADIGRKVSQVSMTHYLPTLTVEHKWARDTHKSMRMKWITILSGLKYVWKWNVAK